jgi:hypothetical protein
VSLAITTKAGEEREEREEREEQLSQKRSS